MTSADPQQAGVRPGPPRGERLQGLSTTIAMACGVLLLLEAVRVWMPSLLFTAETPQVSSLGLSWSFVLPVVAAGAVAPLVRFAGARRTVRVAAGMLVVARILLQASEGGDPQRLLATATVAAAFAWLAAAAAGGITRPSAALGLAAGLVLDPALRSWLDGIDLVWRDGTAGWLGAALLVAVFALASAAAVEDEAAPGGAVAWIGVGSALLLLGEAGSLARLGAVTGLSETLAVTAVLGARFAGLLAVVATRRMPSRLVTLTASGFLLLGLYVTMAAPMPFESDLWVTLGLAGLSFGAILSLSTVGWAAGRGSSSWRAAGAAVGLAVFAGLLAVPHVLHGTATATWSFTLLAVAAAVSVAATIAARPPTLKERFAQNTGRRPGAAVVAAVLLVALVTTGLSAIAPPGPTTTGGELPIRVLTYDVHAGYSSDGRLAVADIGHVIDETDADVVALQEVDRGRLSTGAVDVLPLLAEEAGMPYVFAPAAGPTWGLALLSRFPVARVRTHALGVDGDAAAGLSLVTVLSEQRQVGIVTVHLSEGEDAAEQRSEEVAALRDVVNEFLEARVPLVVLGNFAAGPDVAELDDLRSVLVNATELLDAPGTFPSRAPTATVDQVLVSPGLTVSDLVVTGGTASDHLAVALTVDLETVATDE